MRMLYQQCQWRRDAWIERLRTLLIVALIVVCAAATFGQQGTIVLGAQSGTLVKAEKLTGKEKVALSDATAKVASAQAELAKIKAQIAVQHQMTQSSWMEYSSWYEFDGDFILQRYQSYMRSSSQIIGAQIMDQSVGGKN